MDQNNLQDNDKLSQQNGGPHQNVTGYTSHHPKA